MPHSNNVFHTKIHIERVRILNELGECKLGLRNCEDELRWVIQTGPYFKTYLTRNDKMNFEMNS